MPSKLVQDNVQSFTEEGPLLYKQYPDLRSLQATLSPTLGSSVGPRGREGAPQRKGRAEGTAARGDPPLAGWDGVQCSSTSDGGGALSLLLFLSLGFGSISSASCCSSFKWCRPALYAPMGRRRPKSGGPAKARREKHKPPPPPPPPPPAYVFVVRPKRQRPVPTPLQPTCTTPPPKRRREGRKKDGGEGGERGVRSLGIQR